MSEKCQTHQKCVKNTVEQAKEICLKNGLRLTEMRERILEIIFEDHGAVKAYDVLKKLKNHGISDKPPTIYRALDFFIENKIIHKLHSINSYVVCSHLGVCSDCHFMICKKCNKVEECCGEELAQIITNISKKTGFAIDDSNVELVGLCEGCQ